MFRLPSGQTCEVACEVVEWKTTDFLRRQQQQYIQTINTQRNTTAIAEIPITTLVLISSLQLSFTLNCSLIFAPALGMHFPKSENSSPRPSGRLSRHIPLMWSQ